MLQQLYTFLGVLVAHAWWQSRWKESKSLGAQLEG
jgi:hypothetical protein